MLCPRCGTQLPDEACFCAQCGTSLSTVPAGVEKAVAGAAISAAPIAYAQLPTTAQQPVAYAQQPAVVQQPAAYYQQSAAYSQQPAAPKKRGKALPIVLASVAAVVVVAALVVAGLFTNWFGFGGDALYIAKSQTTTSSGITTRAENEHKNGSLVRRTQFQDDQEATIEVTCDSNGFPTAARAIAGSESRELFRCANTFDARGRISTSTLNIDGGNLKAVYSYYGDSDNLSSVQYSVDFDLDGFMFSTLSAYPLQTYPCISYGISLMKGAGSTSKVSFSEEGFLQSYTDVDGATIPVNPTPRDQRKGQTITSADETRTIEQVFDANGYIQKTTISWDDSSTTVITNEWEKVMFPNRCASIFLRIYA